MPIGGGGEVSHAIDRGREAETLGVRIEFLAGAAVVDHWFGVSGLAPRTPTGGTLAPQENRRRVFRQARHRDLPQQHRGKTHGALVLACHATVIVAHSKAADLATHCRERT